MKGLKPRILIAPLDWGLGHATRCIPIIKELVQNDCYILIAAEGKTKALLEKEFPDLPFIHLEGYRIKYTTEKWMLPISIISQIPKILKTIDHERNWLQDVIHKYGIHAVISDNRFGLYNSSIPCVFITHQLRIKAPFSTVEEYIQELNYQYINQFTECWVPDFKDEVNNLAGDLSHTEEKPYIPVHYVGALSRFNNLENTPEIGKGVLIILSGPEPQRTVFENIIIEQTKELTEPITLVRGLPDESEKLVFSDHVTVYNHLPAEELLERIQNASLVISRCGYSTVMDIAALKKKSVLVPTPGQTEQEYLSKHLMEKNFALCFEQENFHLKTAIAKAENFTYQLFQFPTQSRLSTVVSDFVDLVRAKVHLYNSVEQ